MGRTSAGFELIPRSERWRIVIFLLLLYCVSFVDRLILALLAPMVSDALDISNTRLGLLFGAGFGALYAVVGLPLAQIIDRGHRVRMVTVGVILWGTCTIASGFARGFADLLALRAGVAIGEAVLTPAAVSIIADTFSRSERIRPTALYASAGTFMAGGAFIAGGAAINLANYLSAMSGMAPWRLVLIIVGLPALLLGPLFWLTTAEPQRREVGHNQDYATAKGAIAYVLIRYRLYGSLFLAMASYTTVAISFTAWTPTLLIRAYGFEPPMAGYIFGLIGAVAGIGGAVMTSTMVGIWTRRGREDALILILAGGIALSVAGAFAAAVTRSYPVVIAGVGIVLFFGAVGAVLPPLIAQNVAPSRMRARIMAGVYLATNLVGLALGPALTAWIADHFLSGTFALARALAIVAATFGPIAVFATMLARKSYVAAYKEAAESERNA